LFLMEGASLELLHNGLPISLTQAYSLLMAGENLSWNQHVTYSHLTRSGHIVVRYGGSPEFVQVTDRKLSIVYDVHLADSGYALKKTEQSPDHRLVIMGADEEPLSLDELRLLRTITGDNVPLHVAVVDQGDVLYFNLDWVVMPDIR